MRLRRLRLSDTILPLFFAPGPHAYSVIDGSGLPDDARVIAVRLGGPGINLIDMLVSSQEFADLSGVPGADWSDVPEIAVVCCEIDRAAELAGSLN